MLQCGARQFEQGAQHCSLAEGLSPLDVLLLLWLHQVEDELDESKQQCGTQPATLADERLNWLEISYECISIYFFIPRIPHLPGEGC